MCWRRDRWNGRSSPLASGGAGSRRLRWLRCFRWQRFSLANRAAGRSWPRPARLRVSIRVRVDAVPPGELRRARLFHRSPMWRPLVWDPFHARPRSISLTSGWSRFSWRAWPWSASGGETRSASADARCGCDTACLSLGPYVPGFRFLITLPGFSFFRAPSRWSWRRRWAWRCWLAKGSIAGANWPRPCRSLWWLSFVRDRLGRRGGLDRAGVSSAPLARAGRLPLGVYNVRSMRCRGPEGDPFCGRDFSGDDPRPMRIASGIS